MDQPSQKPERAGGSLAKAGLLSLLGVGALGALYWRTAPVDPPEQPVSKDAATQGLAASGEVVRATADPEQGSAGSPKLSAQTDLGVLRWELEGERARLSGGVMGTTFNVTVVGVAPDKLEGLLRPISQALVTVDLEMSTYKPESAISRFNRPDTERVEVSPHFGEVLDISKRVYEQSGHAFDPTVGPLVRAWGFGPDKAPTQEPQGLDAMVADVDFSSLRWEQRPTGAWTLHKARKGQELDLSAVAKGYGADQVCAALVVGQVANHMVEVGGEICVGGTSAHNKPWRVGVERPGDGRTGLQRALELGPELQPVGMATSGDYRNYREVGGKRVSHTIDPRTGRPVSHGLASVTVLAADSATADAWATALMVLGPEEGFERATQEGVAAYFIVRQGEGFTERDTPAFATLVEPTWAPGARPHD